MYCFPPGLYLFFQMLLLLFQCTSFSVYVEEHSIEVHKSCRPLSRLTLKPGFHPNAIACVACVAFGWICVWIGCLPTQALAFSPVSIQTHATQAIAFGWKPGLPLTFRDGFEDRMFEAKAKPGPTRGQGRTNSRPSPDQLVAKVKAIEFCP